MEHICILLKTMSIFSVYVIIWERAQHVQPESRVSTLGEGVESAPICELYNR